MVVHKFLTDAFQLNTWFSMITGLSLQDINQIELELLEMIDYNLNVDIEE
jgi:hypothetical protein